MPEIILLNCPACGVLVPAQPDNLNCPREARCHRDHAIIEGCPYEPLKARCRGPAWVREVFKPLPQEEADALRKYI